MRGTLQGWVQTGRYVSEATATSLQNCPQSRCRPSILHSKWEEPQNSKPKHLFKDEVIKSSQMVSGQLQGPTQFHRTRRKSERLSPTTRRDRNMVAGDWHPAGLRDGLSVHLLRCPHCSLLRTCRELGFQPLLMALGTTFQQ